MSLKRYEVVIPGRRGGYRTTVQLSDEEAGRLGLLGSEEKAAPPPLNKARRPSANKRAPIAEPSEAEEF